MPLRNIRAEPWHTPLGRAVREVVFGANDGLVSTLAFTAGVSAALQDSRIVLVAGVAEMVAGAVSMFVGGYLSTKSQREFYEGEIRRETREMSTRPDEEREEVRRLYAFKGFRGAELERVVDRITSDRDVWLRVMMEEELGLFPENFDRPIFSATLVGTSFALGAIVPLVPYMFAEPSMALPTSVVMGGLTLFAIGAVKTRITRQRWWRSGLEMVIWGTAAAAVGYGVGVAASLMYPAVAMLR